MKKIDTEKIVKDLWPMGCLEDGDNDPWTKYNDGYCQALKDFSEKVNRLQRKSTKVTTPAKGREES